MAEKDSGLIVQGVIYYMLLLLSRAINPIRASTPN
jgi:hypothetical protein